MDPSLSASRFNHILWARGIEGLIIPNISAQLFAKGQRTLPIEWEKFCVVEIGGSMLAAGREPRAARSLRGHDQGAPPPGTSQLPAHRPVHDPRGGPAHTPPLERGLLALAGVASAGRRPSSRCCWTPPSRSGSSNGRAKTASTPCSAPAAIFCTPCARAAWTCRAKSGLPACISSGETPRPCPASTRTRACWRVRRWTCSSRLSTGANAGCPSIPVEMLSLGHWQEGETACRPRESAELPDPDDQMLDF